MSNNQQPNGIGQSSADSTTHNGQNNGVGNMAAMGQGAIPNPMLHAQIPQLLGLMSNPALAAAAASSGALLPSAAMMSTNGAFMTLQDPFGVMNQGNTAGNTTGTATGHTPILPFATQPHQVGSANAAAATAYEELQGGGKGKAGIRNDLSAEERARQNRDRNREHARSTRLRKKAYVQKLSELVECLHAERTEEVRQRRVAIQHLSEMQNVRRNVVRTFLRYHANYEPSERKWETLLEENFWLKQPITPYRSFPRAEIERDCRIVRGCQGMICDSASHSVMIEGIGSRSSRWMQTKREEFLVLEEANRGSKPIPRCVQRQESRLAHAISSLSSSSESSMNASSGEDSGKRRKGVVQLQPGPMAHSSVGHANNTAEQAKSGSSGSGSGSDDPKKVSVCGSDGTGAKQDNSEDYHDYHAKPLPDPKLDDAETSTPAEDSPEELNMSNVRNSEDKRSTTDSSSGDDSGGPPAGKRRKSDNFPLSAGEAAHTFQTKSTLPPNIAKKGGIPHNIRPVAAASTASVRLERAPAVALPPFAGIGKRKSTFPPAALIPQGAPSEESKSNEPGPGGSGSVNGSTHGPAIIAADVDTSSSSSASKVPTIRASYHMNEDDMIQMDDVLMCPFVFRTRDAVLCGALAECVTPGMLRAHFSARNKLLSMELVFDSMGLMQQLERSSGREGSAQIVPGSLEMALAPNTAEARVITLAQPPYLIVSVNDVWTRTTGYTLTEVEGKEYLPLLEGADTVEAARTRPGKPAHTLDSVADGRPACSTNIHYDKTGRDFVEFVCSYPLKNSNDDTTHLLHVSKELPSLHESVERAI